MDHINDENNTAPISGVTVRKTAMMQLAEACAQVAVSDAFKPDYRIAMYNLAAHIRDKYIDIERLQIQKAYAESFSNSDSAKMNRHEYFDATFVFGHDDDENNTAIGQVQKQCNAMAFWYKNGIVYATAMLDVAKVIEREFRNIEREQIEQAYGDGINAHRFNNCTPEEYYLFNFGAPGQQMQPNQKANSSIWEEGKKTALIKISEEQFHVIWSAAVGRPGYDKKMFQELLADLIASGSVLPNKFSTPEIYSKK